MALLADFAELKKLLDLNQASASSYPALTLIMDSVDAAISNYLGRHLELDSYQESCLIGGAVTQQVPLQGIPIATVSSVIRTASGVMETLVANIDYEIGEWGLYLIKPTKRASLTVQYRGGPDDIPLDWIRAGQMQAAYEWQNRDHIGADSVSTDGGFVSRPSLQLLPEVQRLLNADRHPLLRL